MKLYATVTSERASKSQGGNDFIDVEVSIDRETVLRVELDLVDGKRGNDYQLTVKDAKGFDVYNVIIPNETKGNKQKGEGIANNGYDIDDPRASELQY